jgi:hypothetical protein
VNRDEHGLRERLGVSVIFGHAILRVEHISNQFELTDPGLLGLGAWGSVIEFHSAKLRMLEGEAYLLRATDAAKLP